MASSTPLPRRSARLAAKNAAKNPANDTAFARLEHAETTRNINEILKTRPSITTDSRLHAEYIEKLISLNHRTRRSSCKLRVLNVILSYLSGNGAILLRKHAVFRSTVANKIKEIDASQDLLKIKTRSIVNTYCVISSILSRMIESMNK